MGNPIDDRATNEQPSGISGVDESTRDDDEDIEDIEDADLEDLDEDEIAGLVAIANLDEEAALVYELVADAVEDPQLAALLESFGRDHRRHVEGLEAIVRDLGIATKRRQHGGGLLVGLASTIGALDPVAAVNALIANEQLTNGTYANAIQFVTLSAADAVLTENAADERRHLESLVDYLEKHGAELEEQ